MKYSGIEWIGNIPESWSIRQVKQCFYISKEAANQVDPVVLSLARSGVKVRDISNNEGQLAASYDNYNVVKPGDLLLNPMDLYSGANCNMSEIEGVISPAYVNLRKKIELNAKFFDYFFKTQYWTMAMFAHGKGVSFDNRWTMNSDAVLNYRLPYPKLDIQNSVVNHLNEKLEELSTLTNNENKQIESLEDFKKALINHVALNGLGKYRHKNVDLSWIKSVPEHWTVMPIKSLFDFGKGLPITKDNLVDNGIKVISYGQIHAKYNLSASTVDDLFRFVSPSYLKTNPECLVRKEDFIFADTSEDVEGSGDFVYIDRDDSIFAGYHSIVLKSKTDFDKKYLAYLFMTANWKTQIQSRVSGVKLFSISKSILSRTTVIMPSKEEQEKIVKYLDEKCAAINRLIEIKKNKIDKLEEYKKSLIFEYVTGKKEVAHEI